MVGSSPQRPMKASISSSLLQVAVQVLRSAVKAVAATFGVLRSSLRYLTVLGTYTLIQASSSRMATATVTTAFLYVVFLAKKNGLTINKNILLLKAGIEKMLTGLLTFLARL